MSVRIFVIVLMLTLTGFNGFAESKQCGNYLSPQKLNLSTYNFFNENLGKVRDLNSFRDFVLQLNRGIYQYSAKDRSTFVRSGLYDLQKLSALYIRDLDVVTFEILLRLFTRIKNIHLSVQFLTNVENSILVNLSEFEARNISASVYLLGQLKLKPSPKFIRRIETEFVKKKEDFNPQNLSNLIFGFSVLGIKPSDEFMKAWRERYVFIQDDFANQNLANSLFSFYLMRSDEMVKWFARATTEEQWSQIKERSERRQISQVYEYYEKVMGYRLVPIAKFKGQFLDLIEKPKGGASDLEERVEMGLAMSGADYEVEFKTKPGFYVDFFIPEKNKIIQVDGPSHFVKEVVNGEFVDRQRPQDELIDELLKTFGYTITRKSYKNILIN